MNKPKILCYDHEEVDLGNKKKVDLGNKKIELTY